MTAPARDRTGTRNSRPPAACGTPSGYERHKRNGEPACELCMQAKRTRDRFYRRRQRGLTTDPGDCYVPAIHRFPAPSGDTSWRQRAACAGADPARFEVGDERPSRERTERLVATARRWCAPCPVIADCAAEADRDHLSGLWGGSARTGAYRCSYVVRPLIPEAPGATHIEEEA